MSNPEGMGEREGMIAVVLDADKNGHVFDSLLQHCREWRSQDVGDLKIIVKHNGTKAGRPVAAITFTAVLNGQPHTVQTVTTVRLLKHALSIIQNAYPEL